MNGVDAELSKDMASTPCNTHIAVAAEGSPFPCNSTSNPQQTPNMVEEPKEPNGVESPLLRDGSLLINGHRRKASGTPTEAGEGNGSNRSLLAIGMHFKLARRFAQR
jgi:hypothetical protein